MQEIWKDIVIEINGIVYDYTELYQVSSFGRVKSLERFKQNHHKLQKVKERILKLQNGEYKRVILSKNGIQKTFYIHRIVAEVFIDNPNNLPQVNHKDENKHNNRSDNLEWVTFKENMNYGTKQDRESKIKTKYNVLQYDLDGNLMKEWVNLREIVQNTNYKKSTIMRCCEGKSKTAYGFKWEYKLILK